MWVPRRLKERFKAAQQISQTRSGAETVLRTLQLCHGRQESAGQAQPYSHTGKATKSLGQCGRGDTAWNYKDTTSPSDAERSLGDGVPHIFHGSCRSNKLQA